MPAYLLTWNPARWTWEELAADVRACRRRKEVTKAWSCGNSTSIQVGDRLFLLKQGASPRGIVGSGRAESSAYQDTHWDVEKRRRKVPALYVDLRFDAILDPGREPVLGTAELTQGPLALVHWSTQKSGIRIPEAATLVLERIWSRHLEGLGIAAATPPVGVVSAAREDEAEYAAPDEGEAQLLARITSDVRIFGGKPIVRGRRLAVEHVLGLLAAGDSAETLLENYPWLQRADVRACLVYARRLVAQERIEPLEIATRS